MDENGPNVRNVQSVSVSEFSRDFLAGIPAGAYQVDEQGNFLYCNNEAAKILGYDSSEELLRKNIYDLYFDREYRYKILDRMRKAGGRLESYIHWKRKNGSEIVVNDYAEFVYDDNGKEIGVRGIFVEATYEQLFDDLNAGIFRIGPDMKTVSLVNRAVARIFGFRSPEEMEGIDISKLYVRYEDYENFVKDLEEKEKVENRPFKMRRKDGEIITISVSCRLLKDEEGKKISREGTFTDVTEQERYRRLLEQPLGVYEAQLIDEKLIITYCNETFAEMFGYTSKSEVIGMCIHELYANDEDIPRFEEILRKRDQRNEPVTGYLLKVRRKKGEKKKKLEEFWVEIFSYPIKDEIGEIIGRKGNVMDVSDKVELQRIIKTRREIQRFIHGFIAPMMSIHSTSQIVAREVERSIGIRYGADEMDRLRKKKRNILSLLGKIEEISENLAEKIDETISLYNEKDILELVRIRDALRVEIRNVIRRIIEVRKLHKDAREELSRFQSFVRTERSIKDSRRISDTIRSCFIDLDELDSAYILYLTQSILYKSKIAYHEVEGLRQLMMRAGEEAEDQLFEFQPTNIVDMIEEIIDMYRIDASLKGITIHSHRGKIPDIDVSRNHIERLFSYIIQNAVKYSFKREGYIHVDIADQGDTIRIDVEDYGVGILQEEIQSGKIFEYGYRGEFSRDRNRTGSGIGLSESKRIAEAHKGDIKVKSIPVGNTGEKINRNTPHKTTVTIILPKKQDREGGWNGQNLMDRG